MKKIFFSLFTVLCITGLFLFIAPHTYATTDIVIKTTISEAEFFDDAIQNNVIPLSKNTALIVLLETDGWTKVQYKEMIGFIKSEHLKAISPQYMLVKANNTPHVYSTDSQTSTINGQLHLNSIVEMYGSATEDFVFVKYGQIMGYIETQNLVKPTTTTMTVKGPKDLVVRAIANPSSDEIGQIPKNKQVTMLTNLAGWAFVTSKDVSGYVLASELKKTAPSKVISMKKIALTFDDGPHPKVTMQILKTLEKYDAKATFFLVGQEVKKYPEIVKATFEAGHEIGNHTYNHSKLTTLPLKQMRLQIQSTDSIIKATIGQNATVFRPPYGAYNKTVINQLNVPLTMWTIDTLDWKHRDPKKTVQAINKQVKNGSIILMHDIHQTTADALETILSTLQKQGYEFVTVSELTQ